MLGQRLKVARIEQGLSQRQLCGEAITRNMLSQIESGKAKPSMDTLSYLAQRLGKPVSYFLDEHTLASSNRTAMTAARHSYEQAKYLQCLEQLEAYTAPDEMFDWERELLKSLSLMGLAQQAICQEKAVYARSLLEKAAQAGRQTPYYTPAMERERLLLCYEAQSNTTELVAQLPQDHRELLLRAQGYLDEGAFERAAAQLGAVEQKTARYYYLCGLAAMGQKQYASAVTHFRQAETEIPELCAAALEVCYRELEDFKMAYYYACKQRK